MSRKILIVDDEPDVRYVLRTALEKVGFQIEEAENGVDGLKKLDGNTPDAIVLDLMMPQMDGLTFNQKLKEKPGLAGIPVVVITGKGDLKEFLEIRADLNVAAYLEKPFRVKTLMEKLEEVVK